MFKVHNANVLEWAASYDGPKYHALLCDPPYEIGMMGKGWDGSGISFRPETWAALAEHLYPGAFGMAFASSRTYHRMAVAIEDAGFILHPVIFAWSFASGFPKAARIDLQIDRMLGVESVVAGERKHAPKFNAKAQGYREKDNGFNSRERTTFEVIEAGSELGREFAGHRYGQQAMRPALEPVIVFQRPYAGRAVENIAQNGAGALWIDGGRIERSGGMGGWPCNLILEHTPDCDDSACAPECPVHRIGLQSGESKSVASKRGAVNIGTFGGTVGSSNDVRKDNDDSGTAARFFQQVGWNLNVQERIDLADPAIYVPKSSAAERNAGLENARNPHPTIKPLTLMRYLASLLLPPARYDRRLLVPFAGSGSETIGGMLAGWDHVDGIELSDEYATVANRRIEYWIQRKHELQTTDRPITIKPKAEKQSKDQLEMF